MFFSRSLVFASVPSSAGQRDLGGHLQGIVFAVKFDGFGACAEHVNGKLELSHSTENAALLRPPHI